MNVLTVKAGLLKGRSKEIYEAIKTLGAEFSTASSKDVSERLGLPISTVSPAVTKLRRGGLIVSSQKNGVWFHSIVKEQLAEPQDDVIRRKSRGAKQHTIRTIRQGLALALAELTRLKDALQVLEEEQKNHLEENAELKRTLKDALKNL